MRTDHKNLVYLANSTTPKVVRWKLALQAFDAYYEHIKGTDNVIPDALSRIVNLEEPSNPSTLMACACTGCGEEEANPLSDAEFCALTNEVPLSSSVTDWVRDEDSKKWKRKKVSATSREKPTNRAAKRLDRLRESRAKNVPIIIDGEVTRVLRPHERRMMKDLHPHQLPD